MNKVMLIGRLTKNPSLENGKSTTYCRFSLAIDRHSKAEKKTDFIGITSFGKVAENIFRYLKKGSLVSVIGNLATSKYEKDGKVIYKMDVIAETVEFLSRKDEADEVLEKDLIVPAEEKEDNESSYERESEEYEEVNNEEIDEIRDDNITTIEEVDEEDEDIEYLPL